jgi:hypothetical protein
MSFYSESTKNALQPKAEDIICESLNDFIANILSFEKEENEILVFRGMADIDYKLQPSIGRKNYTLELEKQVFLEFKRQYYLYTDLRPQNDMDVLFLGQHYELPTRLLDWSYNPMVALYFACENEKKDEEAKDGRVYIHRLPNNLNDSEQNSNMPHSIDEIMKCNKNHFIVPNYTDARYRNQQSLFMFCGKPNEEAILKVNSLIIDKDSKKEILKNLALLGYNRTFIYPKLESLCQDIKKRTK